MANTDSFVDEVSDELRRDRMSRLLRRWGWVAILAVVVMVGATSVIEWRRSAAESRAQAFGDAMLAALQAPPGERIAALSAVPVETPEQDALRALLRAAVAEEGGALAQRGDLMDLLDREGLPQRLRHLAGMTLVYGGGTGDAARDATLLEELATPGAPYRPLALEAQAMAAAASGDRDVALGLLRALTEEAGVSASVRRRATQAIVALGGAEADIGEAG